MYYRYYKPYYLSHYGTKTSGRYPKGSGKRPYQRSGRGVVGYLKRRRQTKEEEKRKADRTKALKEELQKRKENESWEERKKRILESGNASEILRNQEKFTNQELASGLERVRLTKQLSEYSQKDLAPAWNAIDKTMKNIGKINLYAETGIKAFNNYKAIQKIFNESGTNSSKDTNSSKGTNSSKTKKTALRM